MMGTFYLLSTDLDHFFEASKEGGVCKSGDLDRGIPGANNNKLIKKVFNGAFQ